MYFSCSCPRKVSYVSMKPTTCLLYVVSFFNLLLLSALGAQFVIQQISYNFGQKSVVVLKAILMIQ